MGFFSEIVDSVTEPITSIATGLLGQKGANDRNEQQMALTREQMAWQERMSNTAIRFIEEQIKTEGTKRVLHMSDAALNDAKQALTDLEAKHSRLGLNQIGRASCRERV